MKTTKNSIRNKNHESFAPRSLAVVSLLALLLLLAGWPACVMAQTPVAPSGSGTEVDPYQIANLDNLAWLQTNAVSVHWDKHYIQTADIDASATSGWNSGAGFNPIGQGFTNFTGTYDGQGHTISGLFIDRSGSSSAGLFGTINGATIKNLGVINVNINITGGTSTGGLVGWAVNSTVNNCYSTGSVSSNDDFTGGLVGVNDTGSTVSNSYSTVDVTGGEFDTGGLVGSHVGSTVSNSYSTGSVSGTKGVGGLVGTNYNSSTVSNSYSTGIVSGTTNAGGLIGDNAFGFDGQVTNSYWNTQTSGQATSAAGTGLTTMQMREQASFSGWDFSGTWSIDEMLSFPYLQSIIPAELPGEVMFSGGDGTSGNPYQVSTLTQLNAVRNHLDNFFIQTADIDASATSGWDGGAGFTPIGNSTTRFIGQYDGNGHTISGLTIDRSSTSFIGLFGHTNSGATIENLGVTNVDISGNSSTGGLVGVNRGSVANCYSTGSVSGSGGVGGLVGDNSGSVTNSYSAASVSSSGNSNGGLAGLNILGTVTNSHATGNVTGAEETGGLVGENVDAEVSSSYSTGSVSGSFQVGGLVGLNLNFGSDPSIVENSYSTGSVNGSGNSVGGLVGLNETAGSSAAVVRWSYSTGSVSGSSGVGGLVGNNFTIGGGVDSGYWNTETSGQGTGIGGGTTTGATGRTTTEMKQQASFSGFDFTGTWSIDEGVSYPYLQNNIPSPLPGFFDDPTVIYNRSLQFNGTDQYVDLGSDPAAISGLPEITVELWVKPAAYENNDRLLVKEDEWYLYQGADHIRWTIHGAGGSPNYVSSGALSTGQWVHVAATYDGTEFSLYINGELKGSKSYTDGIPDSPFPLTLAARRSDGGSPIEFFNGTIDEVRIWSDVRSETEIRRDMFQSLNGDETGLAGYWPLILVSGSTALDRTDNENDGMLTGDPTWSVASHPYGTVITGTEGWRMMTAPVSGIPFGTLLDTLWTQGFTGSDSPGFGDPNVFTWDETAGDWAAISDAVNVPAAGTGFIVYVYEDDEYETEGVQGGFPKTILVDNTQNDGAVAPTLTFTSAGVPEGDGWNLVGNPYGATIDWDATGWTKDNLNAPVYVWSDSAGGAGAYLTSSEGAGTLPGGLIAPFQGFWVQASGAAPALEMTDEVRSAGGVFYKETSVPQIRFRLEGSQLHSNAIVMLNKQAEAGKDPLDAWKLQSLNADFLSLYTTTPEGHALDINALPLEIEQPLELTMNFEGSDLGGRYTLNWDPKDLPDTWAQGAIILTDLYTDRIIALDQPGKYSFEVEATKAKGSGVQPPPNNGGVKGKTSKGLEPLEVSIPVHGPIPTILKAKTKNPRFLLTINPAGSGHQLAGIPETVELAQNYPNPFNPETVIRYGVPRQARVQLNVYDILGRRVATLLDAQRPAGRYQASFNANRLASGLYFYRLRVGNNILTRKMMLIK